MGIDIFHGYGFGTAKPSGFVPVVISRQACYLRPRKRELSQRIRKDKVDYGGKKVLSVSLGLMPRVLIMLNKSEISFFIVVW
jgi:hypothetical protein